MLYEMNVPNNQFTEQYVEVVVVVVVVVNEVHDTISYMVMVVRILILMYV